MTGMDNEIQIAPQPAANGELNIPRGRTQGRELAMRLLYLHDMWGTERIEDHIKRVVDSLELKGEPKDFGLELYRGARDELESIDSMIKSTADNWDIQRMAYVDRAILRLGAYELLFRFDIPPKATISEALEMAKRYSTEKSSSFVNGILDKIFQDHCADKQ